ncbi:hypothetical protein AAVH_23930 [Aphelenchoides avenae]|nr:hypothetical protein AAVH_23930 [Aphelenchus avenae]
MRVVPWKLNTEFAEKDVADREQQHKGAAEYGFLKRNALCSDRTVLTEHAGLDDHTDEENRAGEPEPTVDEPEERVVRRCLAPKTTESDDYQQKIANPEETPLAPPDSLTQNAEVD